MEFNGLGLHLGTLPLLSSAKSRSISAENFSGEPGLGGLAVTGTGAEFARDLGKGWKISPSVAIGAGQIFRLAAIDGPGAIQSMWFTGNVDRNLILRIYWDNQDVPSVECPLSDFFAYGWSDFDPMASSNTFVQLTSWPVTVNPNHGLNCYWNMPFRRKCVMEIENRSENEKTLFYQVNYTLTDIAEDIGYFHAQFRRTNPVAYMGDHVILDGVAGRGHYVGTAMLAGLNGSDCWWGEGEMKFFIDGDEYPSICGTGTEDYFGGAYCWGVNGSMIPYSTPFTGMHTFRREREHNSAQEWFSMYRWHVMDPIRFSQDIKVTVQDLGLLPELRYLPRQDDMATVAYWYQSLPTAPFPELPDVDGLKMA